MKLPRRTFLHLAAGAAALPTISRVARAQAYPTRPVRIIVGVSPGGVVDIVARLIGQWLSERLGQQFIIENRQGGAAILGSRRSYEHRQTATPSSRSVAPPPSMPRSMRSSVTTLSVTLRRSRARSACPKSCR